MADPTEDVALEVNGVSISLRDVLKLAKLNGQLQFVQDAIDAELIRQEAARRGIALSDAELQQAADDFRIANELHDAATTEQWLVARHLSYEDWESLIEARTIADKLREAAVADRIAQHFAENRLSFDEASIYRLVVTEEEVARELRAQIVEDGADFHLLARQYSIAGDGELAGGYSRRLRRADLEATLEAAVFGAQPKDILGPIKDDTGWVLIKVESLRPAALDESVRATIGEQLFAELVGQWRRQARISLPLIEPAAAADEEATPHAGKAPE